jgi:hypothetical protein
MARLFWIAVLAAGFFQVSGGSSALCARGLYVCCMMGRVNMVMESAVAVAESS